MRPTDEELKELRGAAEDAQGPFKSGFMAQCASETLHDMLGAETILGLLELLDEAKADAERYRYLLPRLNVSLGVVTENGQHRGAWMVQLTPFECDAVSMRGGPQQVIDEAIQKAKP